MHKGRRPLHSREFPEISIQTHAFERLCRSLWREQYRNEFAIKLCRIARLRELTLLYAVASFARSVTLRSFLLCKKNLRIANLTYKKHMCGWDAEPFSPPSPRLWRASFARSVALRLFLQAKKSTNSKPDGLPSVALAKDGGRYVTRTRDLCRVKAAL